MWNLFKKPNKQTKYPNHKKDDLEFSGDNDPIDVVFVKNFNQGGGHFLYCDNKQVALDNLKKILEFESASKIYCFDDELCGYVNNLNVKSEDVGNSDFYFMKCKYLIAFDGSIMVTSQETEGKKLNELSRSYIIYAHPTQIIENMSEALQRIKKQYDGNLPKYISSLKLNSSAFQEQKNKNIYLLLVEDKQ